MARLEFVGVDVSKREPMPLYSAQAGWDAKCGELGFVGPDMRIHRTEDTDRAEVIVIQPPDEHGRMLVASWNVPLWTHGRGCVNVVALTYEPLGVPPWPEPDADAPVIVPAAK